MPGQTPLRNAKFTNTPDFDNQGVVGITGPGVFRTFSYTSAGSNTRTLTNADLWTIVLMNGNAIVTIPAGLTANIGDEIMCVAASGTVSFTTSGGATLLSDSLYAVPSARPARLIYAGSNSWILAGAKTAYFSNDGALNDCCGNSVNGIYTFGSTLATAVDPRDKIAYSNVYGTGVITLPADSRVVVNDIGYSINSGNIVVSECTFVDFNNAYTLYDGGGIIYDFYSYIPGLNIFDDSAILGVAFKTQAVSAVYPCDTSSPRSPGTWYRAADMYGISSPVCLNSSGIVTAATSC
jgi:hypothetical protein